MLQQGRQTRARRGRGHGSVSVRYRLQPWLRRLLNQSLDQGRNLLCVAGTALPALVSEPACQDTVLRVGLAALEQSRSTNYLANQVRLSRRARVHLARQRRVVPAEALKRQLQLTHVYADAQQWEEALETLAASDASLPGVVGAAAWHRLRAECGLGLLGDTQQQHSAAVRQRVARDTEASLARLTALDPRDSGIAFLLALLWINSDRTRDALRLWWRRVVARPSDAETLSYGVRLLDTIRSIRRSDAGAGDGDLDEDEDDDDSYGESDDGSVSDAGADAVLRHPISIVLSLLDRRWTSALCVAAPWTDDALARLDALVAVDREAGYTTDDDDADGDGDGTDIRRSGGAVPPIQAHVRALALLARIDHVSGGAALQLWDRLSALVASPVLARRVQATVWYRRRWRAWRINNVHAVALAPAHVQVFRLLDDQLAEDVF